MRDTYGMSYDTYLQWNVSWKGNLRRFAQTKIKYAGDRAKAAWEGIVR